MNKRFERHNRLFIFDLDRDDGSEDEIRKRFYKFLVVMRYLRSRGCDVWIISIYGSNHISEEFKSKGSFTGDRGEIKRIVVEDKLIFLNYLSNNDKRRLASIITEHDDILLFGKRNSKEFRFEIKLSTLVAYRIDSKLGYIGVINETNCLAIRNNLGIMS